MNRGSLFTRSTFRRIHFSGFRYRWTKNDFPRLSRNGPQICRVTRQWKSDLSFVHVPVHVVTVGDVCGDWFKSNPIKLIKVQRQRWMKPLRTRSLPRGFAACAIEAKRSISVRRTRKKKPLVPRVKLNPTRSVIIPQSLIQRSIDLGWILIYQNWSLLKLTRMWSILKLFQRSCCFIL